MKMKSPIKAIIDSYRIKLKPYDPNQVTRRTENVLNLRDYDIPGWTYAED
jgi:hypothetical protein